MGQSTDAILFYGYHLPEDYEVPEEASELWGKSEPVLVGTHCSGDYPMRFLYIQESETTASRGYPQSINPVDMHTDNETLWDMALKDFAKKYDILEPHQEADEYDSASEIGWWLVSYWG